MQFNRFVRRSSLVLAVALATGIGLFAPAATAQATEPISSISLTRAATRTPVSGSKTVNLALKFAGPVASNITYTTTSNPVVTTVYSRDKYVSKPSARVNYTVSPGTNSVPVTVASYTSPGKYQISVSVQQRVDYVITSTATAKAIFEVTANPTYSKGWTSYYVSGKPGKKTRFSVSVYGPDYQKGAKATLYYRAKGKKKFGAVGSGTLNSSGNVSFKTKKGKIRSKGKVYVKVSSVTYAPGYQTTTASLK